MHGSTYTAAKTIALTTRMIRTAKFSINDLQCVFDWDSDGSHDLIGRCTTTFSELTLRDRTPTAAHWERLLINPKKIPGGKKAKKGYSNSGIIHLVDYTIAAASAGGGGGGAATKASPPAAAGGGDA
eukprot:gene17653-33354_t